MSLPKSTTMERVQTFNPFAKREEHDKRSLLIYKILTISTWFLVLLASILNNFNGPWNSKTVRDQNKGHLTSFSLDLYVIGVYWVALLVLQVGYIWHLFASNTDWANAAANVGSHFIANNLFQTAFILLWGYDRLWIAEVVLVMNLFNLTSLYFRHRATPPFIHIPVSSAPLAWTFVAVLWNGAAMIDSPGLALRILANVAVWSILLYGFFYLAAFSDYTMGFELSWLSLALAVQQLYIKINTLQWIFAFVIMAVLLLTTLIVSIPSMFGKELTFRRYASEASEDSERRSLLEDD